MFFLILKLYYKLILIRTHNHCLKVKKKIINKDKYTQKIIKSFINKNNTIKKQKILKIFFN